MTHTSLDLPAPMGLSPGESDANFATLLHKLSQHSVTKHFDAYADVAWDDPEMAIDAADARFELRPPDPLAETSWYQSQPPKVRSAIGLHLVASFMKTGAQFENVLQRGMLEFAWVLPNGAPEFRYAYHEIIEEGHHSLIFQEFVNRTGFDLRGLPGFAKKGARKVVRLGSTFPELFFFFVLGGEEPIDCVQRRALREYPDMHPLLRRISVIHITEEARHLAFAREYLRRHVPQLGGRKLRRLRRTIPFLLGRMSQRMLQPGSDIIATYGIPDAVIREAFTDNPTARQRLHDATANIRNLCLELGLITPRTLRRWRKEGLWPDDVTLPA